MRKAEIIVAAILLGIGVLVVADSIRLNIGWGMNGPEAGFFPFIMGSIVMVGCIIVIIQAIVKKEAYQGAKPFLAKKAIKPVMNVIIPALAMVFLTEYIGLYVAAGLYMAFYMRWIGGHRWHIVIPLSVIVPLSIYVLFDRIFLIPMPKGIMEGIIPFW
jgi:putative tricarboxylic transport membrane protein